MTEKTLSIMLVDDDTFLLDMYSLKFKNKGFEVSAFLKSDEAFAKLKEGFVPDIVVLDVIMPKIDGLELLGKIRAENLIPHTAIVMLTNQSQPEDVEKAEALGVDGYVVKALTIPSEVVDKVTEIYKKKNSTQ